MLKGMESGSDAGRVKTYSTSGGNHPPELWAHIATNAVLPRLIQIAETTPEPLRSQALAMRAEMAAEMERQLTYQFSEALRCEREQARLRGAS